MMEIQTETIPCATIEAFAEKHKLTMKVIERPLSIGNPMRFCARFNRAEVKDGPTLIGYHGNGATQDAAIRDYAALISMKRLVIDAMLPTRREIDVPRLEVGRE